MIRRHDANVPVAAAFIGVLLAAVLPVLADDTIEIELKSGSQAELQTKAQLERLLKTYDLHRYTFTHKVLIDEQDLPHSHPVLTLHTRHLKSDDQLLSTYVHEQLHWYLDANEKQTEAAKDDLRKLYPKVPVGFPEGAQDEDSAYLHLIDCYLEMQADRSLLGRQRADAVMNFWAADHYRWVYRTVINDEKQIADIVRRHGLELHP
jgi:hypothetical protein